MKKTEFKYKLEHSLEERKKEYEKIKKNYENKIPVILEKDPNSNFNEMEKTKYLLPIDFKTSEVIFLIRNKLKLDNNYGLYLIANGKYAITGSELLSEIYEKYKDKNDNFLYINYSEQQIFG